MNKPELKVKPIENGTVIDHITANKALQVLKILGLPEEGTNVTIAMNVPSRLGLKDIVKIEDRELESSELDKIFLIAPDATINIVKDFEIVYKGQVNVVSELHGLIKCTNQNALQILKNLLKAYFILLKQIR